MTVTGDEGFDQMMRCAKRMASFLLPLVVLFDHESPWEERSESSIDQQMNLSHGELRQPSITVAVSMDSKSIDCLRASPLP